MSNVIYKGSEARAKLLKGMREVFDTVRVTYGANGRNVVYNKFTRVPVASNDGVNIAREVEPEDLAELQGANLIKQVAESTNAVLEDGSTATIISSFTMCEKGNNLIEEDKKISPMKLRKEMKQAAKNVIEELKSSIITIKDISDLEKLAITSVEDEEIGKTIAKAIYDAGDNGIVYVNESEKIGVEIEQSEGYQFQQGLVTPYLVTNVDRMETSLEDVVVLITELQVHLTNEFLDMIKLLVSRGQKNILLICDEIHPDVIKFAVQNKFAGKFNLMIVKKPMQKEYLEDISAIVGATAMTQNKGMIVPKIEYLGGAKKVVISEKRTIIFDGTGDKKDEYISSLKSQLESAEDEISKTKLQERIARLTGGVFILNVGEKTEAGLKYLRDKVDDAVNSLKKVWKVKDDGIVNGGGTALFHIGKKLLSKPNLTNGERVVYGSCSATLKQMLMNGGEDLGMLSKIEGSENGGYNALTMEFEPDMFKAGIIDATKVIMTSFSNAVDFAADFITYENLITPIPDKNSGLLQ